MSYCWPVGCIKREENDINIAKPSIQKAAVSGINEMILPRLSWIYVLTTQPNSFVLWKVFHDRDRKPLSLPCIKLRVTGISLRG